MDPKKYHKLFLVSFIFAIVFAFSNLTKFEIGNYLAKMFSNPIILFNLIALVLAIVIVYDKKKDSNLNIYIFTSLYLFFVLISNISYNFLSSVSNISLLIAVAILGYLGFNSYSKISNNLSVIDFWTITFRWLFFAFVITTLSANYLIKTININIVSISQIIALATYFLTLLFSIFILKGINLKKVTELENYWFMMIFASICAIISHTLYIFSLATSYNLINIYTSFFILHLFTLIIGLIIIRNDYVSSYDNLTNIPQSNSNYNIESGSGYLMLEKDSKKAIQLINELSIDKKVLFITRTNPNKLSTLNLDKITLYWLTEIQNTNTINPKDLEKIKYLISSFLKEQKKNAIIAIDGIEYLSTYNSFNHISQLLQLLKDEISNYNAILIIPVNPGALTSQDINLLEKEFEQLNLKNK